MAAASSTPADATRLWQSLNLPQRVAAGLAVAVVVGALGPWKAWSSGYVWGFEGSGWLIVLAALAAVGAMFLGTSPQVRRHGPTVFFGLAALLSLLELGSLSSTVVTPGLSGLFRLLSWGLPLALVASLAAAAASGLAHYHFAGKPAPSEPAGREAEAPAPVSFFRR